MLRQILCAGILFIYFQIADGHASARCLNCLTLIRPEDGCVTDPIRGFFCGPYRISEGYFDDCRNFVSDPDYKNCTSDLACATECVKVYQNRYEDGCLAERQRRLGEDYEYLRCADYARMHVFGIRSCAWEEGRRDIDVFFAELEDTCGCKTIYGECTTTTTVATTTSTEAPGQDPLLLLYILLPCGIIILCAVIGCLCYLHRTHRRRIPADNEMANMRFKGKPDNLKPFTEKGALNRASTNNMYTMNVQSQQPSQNTSLPPQHRAPAVDPILSQRNLPTSPTPTTASYLVNVTASPPYDLQYEQPIPYHKTVVETLDGSEVHDDSTSTAAAAAVAIEEDNLAMEHLYANTDIQVSTQSTKSASGSVNISKAPKPAPRNVGESVSPPITYVENVTIADEYCNTDITM